MPKNKSSFSSSSTIALEKTLSIIQQDHRLVITINPQVTLAVDGGLAKSSDTRFDQSLVIPFVLSKDGKADISLEPSSKVELTSGKVFEKPVHAILGLLPLLSGSYLFVVTERIPVGNIFGKHEVFAIQSVEAIPVSVDSVQALSLPQVNIIFFFLYSGIRWTILMP